MRISVKVAESFEEIVTKARKVDELVAEIATASNEQTQGISQVTTAVSQMDKVTQSNAASAEESASASEELSSQAEMMREAVRGLQHLVGATKSEPPPKTPALTRDATVPDRGAVTHAPRRKSTQPTVPAPEAHLDQPSATVMHRNGSMPEVAMNGDSEHNRFFN